MKNDIASYIATVARDARESSRIIGSASSASKSEALKQIAAAVDGARAAIRDENAKDMAAAEHNGIDQPLIDRLLLNDKGIDQMIEGILQVDALKDPVGEMSDFSYRPTGIQIGKMRVPLGVIAMIYESRPNATTVQLLNTTDRAAVGELLKMHEYVDVIVPRGGKGLIERISSESRIPVIKHLDGICHVYIDADANPEMAISIAFNSKVEKLAVCNALETLLIHADVAQNVLVPLGAQLSDAGIELRGCERAQGIAPMNPATEADWGEEYLGPILSIRVVDDMAQAIAHINEYGSQHTDVIVTENYTKSRAFIAQVDSASVMVNASTQFADGFEYGLGAEVGISTDKIHARGPVGLEGLTSQKYVVFGHGEIRHR
jgi:glutamate-5-semialdehyde dehydrogenase